MTSSAATARTLISSSRISTGSPRRSAVMASPRARPALGTAPRCLARRSTVIGLSAHSSPCRRHHMARRALRQQPYSTSPMRAGAAAAWRYRRQMNRRAGRAPRRKRPRPSPARSREPARSAARCSGRRRSSCGADRQTGQRATDGAATAARPVPRRGRDNASRRSRAPSNGTALRLYDGCRQHEDGKSVDLHVEARAEGGGQSLAAGRPAIGAVEQQSGPGDGGEQPPFRRAERRGVDARGRRSGRRSRRDQRDPVRRAEPGMRMVRGEPALDGEQEPGEQQRGRSGAASGADRTAEHRNAASRRRRARASVRRPSAPRERGRRGRGRQERGDPDRHRQLGSDVSGDRALPGIRSTSGRSVRPSGTGFIPMREARAFWVTAPGRGEIRAQPLPPPRPGEVLVRTRRERDQPGQRKPGVPRRGAGERMAADALPVPGGRVPGAGQIRLLGCRHRRGRPRRTCSAAGCSACIRIRTGSSCPRRRSSRSRTMSRTGARRSPPTWKPRSTGCGTPRPGPGDRIAVIGAGVVGCLVAALAARLPGRGGRADRHRSAAASASRRRSAAVLPSPQQARGEADLVFHASGSPGGARDRARHRRRSRRRSSR